MQKRLRLLGKKANLERLQCSESGFGIIFIEFVKNHMISYQLIDIRPNKLISFIIEINSVDNLNMHRFGQCSMAHAIWDQMDMNVT